MNVELAMAAIQDAKRDLSRFDMNTWTYGPVNFIKESDSATFPCGTTACYAGMAALRAAPAGARIADARIYEKNGPKRGVHVENYAVEALDITGDQALALFYMHDIEEVEAAVKYLADSPDADGGTLTDLFYDSDKDPK